MLLINHILHIACMHIAKKIDITSVMCFTDVIFDVCCTWDIAVRWIPYLCSPLGFFFVPKRVLSFPDLV